MVKIFNKINKKIKEAIVKYAQKDIDELSKILNRPKEGEIVKLENIKIPYRFTAPNKKKLEKRKKYYEKYGYFKTTIILNKDNLLIDGYTTYLLAFNLGYNYITILRED